MKLGKAQMALAMVTGAFVIFTLAFFLGRSSARTVITAQTPPQQPVQEVRAPEPEPELDKLDLNKATAVELEALPGIGAVLAERIICWREENGRFISTEQLMDVQGIGEEKLEDIKDLIYVEDLP